MLFSAKRFDLSVVEHPISTVLDCKLIYEPYANTKGADQQAHPLSLINAIVVRCLDSMSPFAAWIV